MSVRIQKVYGKTPKDARQKAQKEFGDKISIIKMRPVAANKLQPDRGTTYELTIAVDNEAPTTRPLIEPNQRESNASALQQAIARVNTVLTAGTYNRHMQPQQQRAQDYESPYSKASALPSTPAVEGERESAITPPEPPDSISARPDTTDNRHMMSYIGGELSEIRDVLHILMNSAKMSDAADLPDEVVGLHRKFLKNDIDPNLAYDLAEAMQECFSDERGRSIHEHLTLLLKKIIKTSGEIQFTAKPTVVALVGPTGVGKTTTLAKLAAQHQFQKKEIVLITTDDYRIGAIEQLETYAGILSLPIEVAHEPEELEAQIAKHASADLILIDTPGRSQLDVPRIRLIESFLNAARPTETHLLLNMTTRNEDINSVVDRFGTVGVDQLMFTKLDESTCYGSILNVSARTKKPISYLTTGQDVAEDIELATHRRIATFLLRGFQRQKPKS
ncbi:MAG: flagellar biosynthesis protein FlhF [Candidatus Poribacteria bacterium]|nr:flagellar biosynthesis protein FlhF [Candidatus Poribacteria bacterium]